MTYHVRITGPGVDTSVSLVASEDFEIVERLLAKARKSGANERLEGGPTPLTGITRTFAECEGESASTPNQQSGAQHE